MVRWHLEMHMRVLPNSALVLRFNSNQTTPHANAHRASLFG